MLLDLYWAKTFLIEGGKIATFYINDAAKSEKIINTLSDLAAFSRTVSQWTTTPSIPHAAVGSTLLACKEKQSGSICGPSAALANFWAQQRETACHFLHFVFRRTLSAWVMASTRYEPDGFPHFTHARVPLCFGWVRGGDVALDSRIVFEMWRIKKFCNDIRFNVK